MGTPGARAASRLSIVGSRMYDPSGEPIRLTGFNFQLGRTTPEDGRLMRTLLPGANVGPAVPPWVTTREAPVRAAPNVPAAPTRPHPFF